MIATSTRGYESGTSIFWSVAKGWAARSLKGKSPAFRIMSAIFHIMSHRGNSLYQICERCGQMCPDVPSPLTIVVGAKRNYAYLTTQNPTIRASYIAVLHTAIINLHNLPSTLLPLGAVSARAIVDICPRQATPRRYRHRRMRPSKNASHASPPTLLKAGLSVSRAT